LQTPAFYQNYLGMNNTADATGGKPIAVSSQCTSGVSTLNPLVAFYDIHGRKGEVYSVLFRTPHEYLNNTTFLVVVTHPHLHIIVLPKYGGQICHVVRPREG
jgi:hypothetical protein